ncbi:hypothetical protein [Segetibacter sp.]|jgi:hypothetical protein|uniref:hypothetical protein n=1 Tax=Segetibacter sp. TaxID=2231182 RepID=UPI00263049DE|nr:hypothetical protein [Segetibacter sp.]MCW3080947.1 hypothetical protein [Segetibacter sp.]
MKKLLFVFVLGAFAACGGGESTTTSDSTSVSTDATSGTMSTDTTGASAMSTDTTSMSTPH